MNTQPISAARDADLRLSVIALHRAAMRAKELAQQSGGVIVNSQFGVIQAMNPTDAVFEATRGVQESTAPCGDQSG